MIRKHRSLLAYLSAVLVLVVARDLAAQEVADDPEPAAQPALLEESPGRVEIVGVSETRFNARLGTLFFRVRDARLSASLDDIVVLVNNERVPDETLAVSSQTIAVSYVLAPEQFLVPLEFLEFGAQKFVYSLRDDPDFMDHVLTGRERDYYEIWHRATNADPLQDIHGQMGAEAVRCVFAGGSILEVGGGTGNGVRNIFECLTQHNALEKITNYVFTDVSMPFIMGTRKEIQREFPSVKTEWRFLDINRAFNEQKISENSQDLIYGVNAAHIAKDTVEFLKHCRATLKPGGLVVFSERIRRSAFDMAPREIALNLSEYHRNAAEQNSDYRPWPPVRHR